MVWTLQSPTGWLAHRLGRATDDRSGRSAQNHIYLFLFIQREVSKPTVLTQTVFQQSLHFSKVEQNLGKAPVKPRNVQNTKHSSISLRHRIIYKAVAKHYTGRTSWAMESKLSQCDSKSSDSSYYTAYLKMLLPLQQYYENILVLRNNSIRQWGLLPVFQMELTSEFSISLKNSEQLPECWTGVFQVTWYKSLNDWP